jgi:pimeloyl-ACP methyl ester carboxylesterase/class 3 adenylate cyclase
MRPRTQYADSAGCSIAYQVIGDGPVDLFFLQGLLSHLDMQWCDPLFSAFLHRLAARSRLIVMDQRGVGLSDGAGTIPTIDERVADMAAVADAVGSKRMFLIGHCHGGPPAIVYTATHPERVAGLILMSTFANGTADINHAGALSEEDFDSWMEAVDNWGEGRSMSYFNPSRDEGRLYRHLYASFERAALTRGMARAAVASTREIDVTAALGSIRVPTMVMHCTNDFLPVESGRFLANSIPDARFVELDGADHAPFVGTGSDRVAAEVLGFIGAHDSPGPVACERFGAVLFTDIVDSTKAVARYGDERWAEMMMRHDIAVRDEIDRRRGDCQQFTGDGYLATFSLCEDALRCAAALQGIAAGYGLAIRCGVHAGDYKSAGEYVIGLTVIIASRLMSAAGGGEILVSQAVSTAVAGTTFQFGPASERTLKGVPGTVTAAELVTDIDLETAPGRWLPDPGVHGPRRTWLDRLMVLGARRFPNAAHVLSRANHAGDNGPAVVARRRGLAAPTRPRS